MRKIGAIVLVVTMLFALSATALANKNQDFTGTPVVVTAPEWVYVDEPAEVAITVENTANRGLPQLGIWVNGELAEFYAEVAKGGTVEYVIPVDTSVAGMQTFEIEVWTRKGNKNFAAVLYSGTVSVEVRAKAEITAADIEQAIQDAILAAEVENIHGIVYIVGNNSFITLTINGESYSFEGGKGVNSDKRCTIGGVTFTIGIQQNGARFTVTAA